MIPGSSLNMAVWRHEMKKGEKFFLKKAFFNEWLTTVGNWSSVPLKTFWERHCRIVLLGVKMLGYLSTVSYASLAELLQGHQLLLVFCPVYGQSLFPLTKRERHGKLVQELSASGLQEGSRKYGWDPDNIYVNRSNEGQKEALRNSMGCRFLDQNTLF